MKVNQQSPDLIVVAGDIFDNEYDALDDPDQLVKIFRQLKSQYGVYAVYGNHDIDEKILAGFTFGSGLEGEVTPEKLHDIVQTEIGLVFKEVLKDAGVYKCTEEGRTAFMRFVDKVNA